VRCLNPHCATLLPDDAEICDECRATDLGRLEEVDALLLGDAGGRSVGFALLTGKPNLLGRSTPDGPSIDVDLARLPGSESVHRQHARVEGQYAHWTVTHLGRNPLVVFRPEGPEVIAPGTAGRLQSGDWLQVGRIRLRFLLAPRLNVEGGEHLE